MQFGRTMGASAPSKLRSLAILVIVMATIAGSVGLVSVRSATGETVTGPLVRLANSVVPEVANGELQPALTAASAGDRPLTLTVTLNRANQAGFETYLNAVQDSSSPLYHHYLTQSELTEVFGPSQSTYDSVLSWLRSQGFTLVKGSDDRLTLTVRAARAVAARALDTPIDEFRSTAGRLVYANTKEPSLPVGISQDVLGISGLSDLTVPTGQPPSVSAQPSGQVNLLHVPEKCADMIAKGAGLLAGALAAPYIAFLVLLLSGAFIVPLVALASIAAYEAFAAIITQYLGIAGGVYAGEALLQCDEALSQQSEPSSSGSSSGEEPAIPPFIQQYNSDTGTTFLPGPSQKIGFLEFDTFHPSDVQDFLALNQEPANRINQLSEVNVDGGVATPGAGEDEVLLDIDSAMMLDPMPNTSFVVYDAPPSTGFAAMFNAMIADGDTVISNSWSECEDQVSQSEADSINSVLAEAAASGITVLNGTGDSGSTCLDGSPGTVGVPADSPNATAVGGSSTVFTPSGQFGATWWNGTSETPPTGQGGFGVSKYFARPSYQSGLTSASGRSVPDLVAAADPTYGFEICAADLGGCPTDASYGGTSFATPQEAAEIAMLNEYLGHNVGNLNSLIYPLAGTGAFEPASTLGSDFAHVGLGSLSLFGVKEALDHLTVGAVDPTTSLIAAFPAGVADGSSSTGVEINLEDSNGLPVSGKAITLTSNPACNAVISQPSGHSDIGGAVRFEITDTIAQTCTFTATDTTDVPSVVLSAQPTITFTPPAATGAQIYGGPSQVPDDGTTQATITVYLQNDLGQPASGKTVSLSENGGAAITPAGSTAPGTTAVTNSAGNAIFTTTDTNPENVQFTAVDTTDGNLPVPGNVSVTFYSGSPPSCTASPTATTGYSISTFSSGYNYDPYDQVLPGNFNINGCDGTGGLGGAGGLAFDPNGNLYVSDFYTGTINVIPPGGGSPSSANQLPDTSLGPDDITSLAFGKDGELYATLVIPPPNGINDNEDPEVVQLDPSTGAILRVVASESSQPDPLTYCPGHLAVDPLTGDLFVSGVCNGYLETQKIDQISDPSSSDPTVSVYADTSGYGQDGIPYGLAFAPNGTLYAIAGGDQILAISGTNVPQPATITPVVQYTSSYGLNLAITGTSSGAATSLIAQDFSGNVYSIDLTKNPPAVSSAILTGEGYNDGFQIGPDSCLYLEDASSVYRFGKGTACGSSKNTSTVPSLTLRSSSSLSSPSAGSPVSFTATLNNIASPAGTPIVFSVTGANTQLKLVDANSSGVATFTYSALHPGIDTVVATTTIGPSNLTSNPLASTWVAGKDTTFLDLNGSQEIGPVGQVATFTASLDDISQSPPTPVGDATIGVMVGSQGCTITTNTSGTGSCQITPSTSGLLPVAALFGGSTTLTASGATGSFLGSPSATPPPIAPTITNTASDTVPAGSAFTYSVTTTGAPTPAISLASGSTLPSGVTLIDNGNGTATLAGTSSVAAGVYNFTIQAANGVTPTATQLFVLTVTAPPKFTSAASDSVPAGTAFSFSVTTSGSPTPAISLASGSKLPSGVTLIDNGNGTATLAGTSSVAAGAYMFTIQAANGVTPTATQLFALTVAEAGGQISLKFEGLLNYMNSGSLTSGGFTVGPSSGTITSVTGTGTIAGIKGGSATIIVNIHRYTAFGLSAYLGTISVSDPSAHVNTIAVVLTSSLTRVGSNEASGTAFGLLYRLNWTV